MGKTKRSIIAIAVIVIIAVASVSALMYYQGQNSNVTTPSFPITLVDDMDNVLNLTKYPQRIVSLAPSNTQILFAVGAGDNVIGVTDYCKDPYNFSAWVEAGNMSSIGSYYKPAIEPIVALDPDLVLAALGSSAAADTLRSLGYNVLTLNPKDLNGIMKNMLMVGKATGHEAQAKSAVADMQQRIDAVVNAVKNAATKPKVYAEINSDPYMSIGNGTFIDASIKLAGGQNIFENTTVAYPEVSAEAIIEQNPDIIIFPSSMGEIVWGSFVANRPGWNTINAIKNGKMYAINGDIFSLPGPRQVDLLEIMAKIIHPEIFGNYTDTS